MIDPAEQGSTGKNQALFRQLRLSNFQTAIEMANRPAKSAAPVWSKIKSNKLAGERPERLALALAREVLSQLWR